MLVSVRATGQVFAVRKGRLDPVPLTGLPAMHLSRPTGMLDMALHPKFSENRLIYFTYHKPLEGNTWTLALGRGRYEGAGLSNVEELYAGNPVQTWGSRLVFAHDGLIYITVGGAARSPDAQATNTIFGKVLRLKDDGTVPPDNPFVGKAGYKPEVYTLGHRSSLGLAVHPVTGQMWLNENGPNGGDEINILKAGANYGWPTVSYGRQYTGPWQSEVPGHAGFEAPLVYWVPSIAVSGMAFYTGDKLSKWKGDVFVGSLRTGEIPGTGHIERILFNDKMEELRRESLLVDLRQRIRDVRQGPDGLLYVLTDEKPGALLRIEPAS